MYSLGESLDSTTEGERTRDLPKENDFCIMDRYDFYFFFNFDFASFVGFVNLLVVLIC